MKKLKEIVGKAKCFFEERNLSYVILFLFKPFIENKFLLVHGIANLRQCFVRTENLNIKLNRESEEEWIKRPYTNERWV